MLISTHKNKVAIEGTSVTSAESWLNMRDCYMFLQNSPQQCRCGLCMLGNFQTLPQGDQNAAEGISISISINIWICKTKSQIINNRLLAFVHIHVLFVPNTCPI